MADYNLEYTGITFTNGGTRRYLYSDSPEHIAPASPYSCPSIGYLTGTTFNANERMDFEFYHHNYYGATKRFGIVVQNGNSTAVTLTLHNRAIGTSSGVQSEELEMTSRLMVNYFNSSATTVTIPANGSQFVLYTDVPNGKLVNGKLSMTSNKGNEYARIVYGDTSTSAAHYFTIVSQVAAQANFFCGQLNYIQKNATVNANSISTFVLGEWNAARDFKNKNEYQTVLSYKSGGSKLLGGNYGVIYQITFTNLQGRRVKLYPNDFNSNQYRKCNRIVFRSGNKWYTSQLLTASNPSTYMTLDSNVMTIVIPGGNAANLPFKIE